MHTDEQRLRIGQRCRHRQLAFGKFTGSIFQINLIEHTVTIVLGQCGPVLQTIGPALVCEATQVSLSRNLVSTQSTTLLPYLLPFIKALLAQHPSEHESHVSDVVDNGEATIELLFAAERVVHLIRPDHPLVLADGNNINTLARLQRECPIVFGHTRDDMIAAKPPAFAHAAVFHPDVLVLGSELHAFHGILLEDGRMGLTTMMKNLPLVVDKVLYGECRRDDLT